MLWGPQRMPRVLCLSSNNQNRQDNPPQLENNLLPRTSTMQNRASKNNLRTQLTNANLLNVLHEKLEFHLSRPVSSVPFVATKIRDEPEGLSTARDHALVRPLPRVNADMLRPSPSPFERLGAALHRTLQRPVVQMNPPMLQKVLVHVKMLATPLPCTKILLVELQVADGVESHDTTFHVTLKLALQILTPFGGRFWTVFPLLQFRALMLLLYTRMVVGAAFSFTVTPILVSSPIGHAWSANTTSPHTRS